MNRRKLEDRHAAKALECFRRAGQTADECDRRDICKHQREIRDAALDQLNFRDRSRAGIVLDGDIRQQVLVGPGQTDSERVESAARGTLMNRTRGRTRTGVSGATHPPITAVEAMTKAASWSAWRLEKLIRMTPT